MDVKMEEGWKNLLQDEFEKDYFEQLVKFVKTEYANKQIFPPAPLIFNAFDQCPLKDVKVVILGQDPYHGEGQAHGLCFSVNDNVQFPPSLLNIFKEIQRDLNISIPSSGNLLRWARQGVMLLNATLTVEAHKAGSHQGKGWELFTDSVIHKLASSKENLVFMLWGSYAQQKAKLIDNEKHLILRSVHPSPLSAYRGFIGCGHFSEANKYLRNHQLPIIEW